MQVNPNSRFIIPQISGLMKQFIVTIVKNELFEPGSFESSKKHLKAYCENEMLNYHLLESSFRLFFGLIDDYKRTKDPVLYHFLILQGSICFIDEHMFELLPIVSPREVCLPDFDLFSSVTSANNCGMVGSHLVGF